VVPKGLPTWITSNVIDDTLRTFQPFYEHHMTVDEAVGILLSMGTLFGVLKGAERVEIETEAGAEELDAA
jgi:hypothetical protein